MNLKTVVLGLGFLMFIFCSVQSSQGALKVEYNVHFLSPPNEHPWQDSGSPPVGDTVRVDNVSYFHIVIGPAKVIRVNPSSNFKLTPCKTNIVEDCSDGRNSK
jgi:hypothetical protein